MVLQFTSGIDVTNGTDGNTTFSCTQEQDYDDLDIRNVTGKWKVAEVYMHLTNEGVKMYTSCPVITIWEEDEFPRSTYGVCSYD